MSTSTELSVELVPIERLRGSPSNPRLNEAGVPHVAASIARFGWQQPIVARLSGEVIAGNTRLKAAQKLGHATVPVVWFRGTDTEAAAFMIADNRTHEFSEWNEPELAKLLVALRAEDSLDGVGYSSEDLDALLRDVALGNEQEQVDDPGPGEIPAKPSTALGDLWLLGDHRLLCGDSTSADDVARLLAGQKAALLATDPPYCVDYTGADRPDGSGKDWTHVYREVDIEDLGAFLDGVMRAVLPHLQEGTALYIWHAHVQQPTIAAVFERHDLLLHQVLVWVKPTAVFGHSYYRWRHEPCAFGWKRGEKPRHASTQLDTVWEADWDGRARFSTFHPTSKPTKLFEIPIEQHTPPGAICLEPFSGSGSQILAAEKLRRRCFAMELQPAFVDGTIDRWQRATGKTATLEATGETFAEVAAARAG